MSRNMRNLSISLSEDGGDIEIYQDEDNDPQKILVSVDQVPIFIKWIQEAVEEALDKTMQNALEEAEDRA